MNLLKTFKLSLQLPKKEALFRLNRMKMSTVMVYLFILMFIASVPGGVKFVLTDHSTNVPPTLFVLQFFFFYYLLFAFIGLMGLSILALVGLWISKSLRRKLTYRQLWKMSVFSVTIPVFLYTLAESIWPDNGFILIIFFGLALAILTKMIGVFPRRQSSA
ncbi:MAG TPA: DUF1189 family protein [Bacillales bacterium]